MTAWKTLPLGSRAINLDSRRVPVRAADRKPGPFPYYGASGVVDHVDGFLFDGLHLLVAEDGENLRSRKTPIAFLADGKFWVNNHAHILQGNTENDTRFLAYALEATDVTGYLSGSTQPKLTQRALAAIPITAPDLHEQREVARTLGSLDDKIESNRRVVTCASTFLDAMIDETAASLPRIQLSHLVTTNHTTIDPSHFRDAPVDHFSLPAFDNGAWPERVPGASIMSAKVILRAPSVLVSRLNPRFNRTWWATPMPEIPALASTEFSCLQPQPPTSLADVWLAVRHRSFRDELPRRVTGTSGSHQRIRQNDLLAIEVPDTRQLNTATRLNAEALLDLIQVRLHENASLASLHKTIAPYLLSGQLRVREAAEVVEAAA